MNEGALDMGTKGLSAICMAAVLAAPVAWAGEAEVVSAKATKTGSTWRFDVTVRHGDEGWDHYADAWRVLGPDGTVYGERILYHPHENEQPFTRSLGGVEVPAGIGAVTIEAHDKVHGWGRSKTTVKLP